MKGKTKRKVDVKKERKHGGGYLRPGPKKQGRREKKGSRR